MAVSKVILNGNTLIDTTDKTVTESSMLSGVTALKNDGTTATGTIASKTSSDLSVSGATVTAPAGNYASAASKTIPNAAYGLDTYGEYFTDGGVRKRRDWAELCTDPGEGAFSAGYLPEGTVTSTPVVRNAVAANTTVTPSGSAQTVGGANWVMEGALTVAAMPSGSAGTPTATKGAVSNHSVSVTPSVTNTTGYITGGTKTGTAVTVTAAELESGTKSITNNGTNIDVTGYAAVDVNVSGGGGAGAISIVDTPDAAGGTVRTITAVDLSDTTAVAGDVAQGKYFYTADGTKTAGTASGGGGSASTKQVNFIDYDGTILYSYTAQEANALTALPANPSHTGLTAQGWNWTLQQIKAQLTAMPDGPVWVGQMYITQSGDTEIDVRMPEGRLSPILTICVNGTITVDWGDNTTANTVTGTSLTTRQAVPHTYAAPGDYMMTIHVVSGSFTFYGSTSYFILRKNTTGNENRVYASCIQAIRLGSGITSIGDYAFYYCYSLASITLPSGVTSIGNQAFSSCYNLNSITLPSGVTSIGNQAFYYCYSLASITLPSGVTSIGNQAFSSCSSLNSITIPSRVTSIGSSAFNGCSSLNSITIPSGVTSIDSSAFSSCYSLNSITIQSGVTSIGNQAFYYCYSLASITIPSGVTSIGNQAFSYCYSLASITIPSSVTSIGNQAFQYCYGVAEYHIEPTTVPTGGTTMFQNIVSDCVIYVPTASLDSYKTANNWSTYASYMQGE